MAKVSATARSFSDRLERAVQEGLKTAGIKAVTRTERVPGTKLVRLMVMAQAFANLTPTERQNLVWRIIETQFTGDEQLRISVVIALSAKEVGAGLAAEMGLARSK